MINIPCVIFAGGKSSRMGEDKALLPFDGFSTLSEFQYQKLKKIFTHVYISSKSHSTFNFSASFIEDIASEEVYAPTLGFISSFKYLNCEKIFVMSVDTPLIQKEDILSLVQKDTDNIDATVARVNGKVQPMCGIYHRSLENDFLDMYKNNRHKLHFLLQKSKTLYLDFKNENSFLNLNEPQDYKKALTLI